MALSEAFVERHISGWQEKLDTNIRSYRKHWPQCLFHHAPLENALLILRDAHIRSRNDPKRQRLKDVAAPGVIENRQDAHDRVRLYFRPRNPTQFHIEGIQKDMECKYGADAHAPILIMFVLNAKKVLSLQDLKFSNMNMQIRDAQVGNDEVFFNAIPFDKVYHEGPTGGDRSIIAHRCAEVLPSSPLPLKDFLNGIWFRSEPERDTLLYHLGEDRLVWERFCGVSEELKVFDKRYSFLSDLSLSTEGVKFRLNYRHDYQSIDLKIKVFNSSGLAKVNFHNATFVAHNKKGGNWIYRRELEPDNYLVRVEIEGHLAFEANIALEDSLI